MSRAQAVIRRAVTQPSATWSPISVIKEAADKQRISCVFAESQVPVPLGQFAIFKYTVMWQGQVSAMLLTWCLNTALHMGRHVIRRAGLNTHTRPTSCCCCIVYQALGTLFQLHMSVQCERARGPCLALLHGQKQLARTSPCVCGANCANHHCVWMRCTAQHSIEHTVQEIASAEEHDKKTAKKEAAKRAVDFILAFKTTEAPQQAVNPSPANPHPAQPLSSGMQPCKLFLAFSLQAYKQGTVQWYNVMSAGFCYVQYFPCDYTKLHL